MKSKEVELKTLTTSKIDNLQQVCGVYAVCMIEVFKVMKILFFLISFNVGHDAVTRKCLGEKNGLHVMAPSVNLRAMPWSWSSCSRQEITEFLE